MTLSARVADFAAVLALAGRWATSVGSKQVQVVDANMS